MRLALFLFSYRPFGGLQRDFLAIANACIDAGCEVDVYTGSWTGAQHRALSVHLLPARGFSNHARNRSIFEGFARAARSVPYDAKVGFDRIPGLDVYYAADPCFAEKAHRERGWFYRLTPRYRQYIAFEQAIFARGSATEIITIDRVYQYGVWAGSVVNLTDEFNNGRYYVKIYDAASGTLIYSRGFDSYFGEYQLSGPALKGIKKTYHENTFYNKNLRHDCLADNTAFMQQLHAGRQNPYHH